MSERLYDSICGVVLAGGAGRRIGAKKALIQFGGKTLVERACHVLSGVFSEVLIVADEPGAFRHLSFRCIRDRIPNLGPIAGLEAALHAIPDKSLFVVACDMPFLNPDVIRAMLVYPDCYDLVIPLIAGRLHPLHAMYRPACLPVIEDRIKKTNGALRDLPDQLNCLFFREAQFRPLDPQFHSLVNVNTPDDLRLARMLGP